MEDVFAQMLLDAENPLELVERVEVDQQPNNISQPTEDPLINLIKEVKSMRRPKYAYKKKSNLVEVDDFDPSMNILNQDVRTAFVNETVSDETEWLTAPTLTTSTISGAYTNIKMMEEDWIKYMKANKRLLAFRCNYGEVIYDKYTPLPRIPKKKKIERKKQGNGTEFNSQISIYVNMEADLYKDDDIIPSSVSISKFKLFRNGQLQLPGAEVACVDNIVSAAKHIEAYCNSIFNPQQTDLTKLIMIVNVNIRMKNYKFRIKMLPDQIVNTDLLMNRFADREYIKKHGDIEVFDIIVAATNVSIKFNTPIYHDDEKKMRLTIEKSGKIGIKGALYVEYSTKAFNILDHLLKVEKDAIVNKYKANFEEYNVPEKSSADILKVFSGRDIVQAMLMM